MIKKKQLNKTDLRTNETQLAANIAREKAQARPCLLQFRVDKETARELAQAVRRLKVKRADFLRAVLKTALGVR